MATYNWDIGTIERPTDSDRQFEVPSHQWVDLTDKSGAFGATILTDCKNASDKPDDHTLRLTLLRTPGIRGGYDRSGHAGPRAITSSSTDSPDTRAISARAGPTGRLCG